MSLMDKIYNNLNRKSGLSENQVKNFSPEETRQYFENKTKRSLSIVSEFPVIGRGNVLRDRLVTTASLDKTIDSILK